MYLAAIILNKLKKKYLLIPCLSRYLSLRIWYCQISIIFLGRVYDITEKYRNYKMENSENYGKL